TFGGVAGSGDTGMKSANSRNQSNCIRVLLLGLAAVLAGAISIVTAPPANAAWEYNGDLDSSGTFALHGPYGVAVDQTGEVFVSDTGAHRVVKFAHGKRKAFGSYGSGRGQLAYPNGVAVQDIEPGKTWVYVADQGNHRIEVFNDDGHFVKTFGEGELNNPVGIAVVPQSDGSAGQVFVTEDPEHEISVFTASGKFLRSFSCTSCPEGQIHRLGGGIAIRRTGDQAGAYDVYASDSYYDGYHGRVLVMDPNGQWQVTFGSDGGANQLDFPDGVAVDPLDNSTWVADSGAYKLLRLGPSGEVLTSYTGVPGQDDINDPHGIALYTVPRTYDQPALMYVVNTESARVHIYKEAPGRLGALSARTHSDWIQNHVAYFTVFYNGIEQTCTGSGATAHVVVDPTDPNPAKFTLDLSSYAGPITTAGTQLQMDLTDRQTKLIQKAWAAGKQIRVALDLSGKCQDESVLESSPKVIF
ncbi:MAG TPA: NHL repeat-containing protein, partial [Rhizomicrobium sp.]